MTTGDGFGYRWGRNGEFCLPVGPATRTAGILAEVSQRCWLLVFEQAIWPIRVIY